MNRKVVLYIAMSLDGYIADKNGELDFLSIVHKEGEDYGYFEFINSIDTVLIGRKTFDWILSHAEVYPHLDKKTYVITRQQLKERENIQFYNGDIQSLISKLKSEKGNNIFCDGGAELVNLLLRNKLIDEMIISVIPIILGGGIKLFDDNILFQNLSLISSKPFESGLVQLHYNIA